MRIVGAEIQGKGSRDVSPTDHLERVFRTQAEACADLGSPMYAQLLRQCADDIAAEGVVRQILRGHERDSGPSALSLRLLGAVHRLVLSGRASELAAHYPSTGGTYEPEPMWPRFVDVLREHENEIRDLLNQPPQTNEVGRSAALAGTLLHAVTEHELPVHLHEIGASAGLNLLVDHYRVGHESGTWWGPEASPVQMRGGWAGPLPPVNTPLQIVRRHGTDVSPLDVSTEDGARRLLSYIWPDMAARFERVRGALAIAAEHAVRVEHQDAVAAVAELELSPDRLTVLWHSVMWQYLDREAQVAIEDRLARLGAGADDRSPLVHTYLEPARRSPAAPHEFLVVGHTWPGDRRQVLGVGAPHGIPTRWE